jgi:hypothetical protein
MVYVCDNSQIAEFARVTHNKNITIQPTAAAAPQSLAYSPSLEKPKDWEISWFQLKRYLPGSAQTTGHSRKKRRDVENDVELKGGKDESRQTHMSPTLDKKRDWSLSGSW